jgi:hypothetical protein
MYRCINSSTNVMLTLNSSINFLIYCLVGKKFRRIFVRMVCGAPPPPSSSLAAEAAASTVVDCGDRPRRRQRTVCCWSRKSIVDGSSIDAAIANRPSAATLTAACPSHIAGLAPTRGLLNVTSISIAAIEQSVCSECDEAASTVDQLTMKTSMC